MKIEGLRELLRVAGNLELIASKMKRSTRTLDRWSRGLTNPSPAEAEKLRRVVNGMRQRIITGG